MEMKQDFSRLREMLIGSPDQPPPPVQERGAAEMIGEMQKIPSVLWGKYAFSREPLRSKFSHDRQLELTEKAEACGTFYADQIASQYGTRDPKALADAMGLQAEYPERPTGIVRVTFAEYRPPKNISIYTDAVDKAQATLCEAGVAEALGENFQIVDLLLAHELFHHVEHLYAKEIFTRTEKVDLWAIKPFHNRSSIFCLGEIAAMAFTKHLLGLTFSPYVMDVFLIYGYNQQAACRLFEEIIEITTPSDN